MYKKSGADPGFQVRVGALKIVFGGISCEKSRFYAKKIIFFPIAEGGANILGYFVWKIMILCQKILFFPILGGAHARCAPPGFAPENIILNSISLTKGRIVGIPLSSLTVPKLPIQHISKYFLCWMIWGERYVKVCLLNWWNYFDDHFLNLSLLFIISLCRYKFCRWFMVFNATFNTDFSYIVAV